MVQLGKLSNEMLHKLNKGITALKSQKIQTQKKGDENGL